MNLESEWLPRMRFELGSHVEISFSTRNIANLPSIGSGIPPHGNDVSAVAFILQTNRKRI